MSTTLRHLLPGTLGNGALPFLDTHGFEDQFERPDNAVALGSTPAGRLWTVAGTTGMLQGITGGRAWFARPSTLGPSTATAEAYAADGTLETKLAVIGSNNTGLTFRYSSITNYLKFSQIGGAVWRLEKNVAGTTTTIQSTTGITPAAGDVAKVVLAGTSVKCYVNNVLVITATVTEHATNTQHGLYNSGASTNRFEYCTFTAA